MPALIRTIATGTVTPTEARRDVDALQAQLTVDTGVECTGVTLEPLYDPIGDPDTDRLVLEFAGAPVEATVDATLAAFPSLPEPVGQVVAVSPGNPYVVYSQTLEPGEMVAFDVHVVVAFGNQADFNGALLDQYTVAYRRTTGPVRFVQPQGSTPGDVPGLRLDVEVDATSVRLVIKVQRAGTLHILLNEPEIMAHRRIPA